MVRLNTSRQRTLCEMTDRPSLRKVNKSPSTVEEKDILKKLLTDPPVKKIDLHFPLGLEVTARNLKGVTIKDAMDAIHKQFKKRVSFPSLGLQPGRETRVFQSSLAIAN